MLDNLISKVEIFGMHFASLDVRQDSSVHGKVLETLATHAIGLPAAYNSFSDAEKIKALQSVNETADLSVLSTELHKDTLSSMKAIKTIQSLNGEAGLQPLHHQPVHQCVECDGSLWAVAACRLECG